MLTLKSTANIKGDINTGKLAMEAGAVFDGKCKMGSFKNPEDLKSEASETHKHNATPIAKPADKPAERPAQKMSKHTLSGTQV
jgi:cytoskeletal protein CcmA (bactofilin family)